MALDGLVISNIVHEINTNILDGRINKINQPQKDEIVLTIIDNFLNFCFRLILLFH